MRIFGRDLKLTLSPRNSGLENPEEWFVREILRNMANSGISVTPLKAMGISTVYACVNAVSRTLSTLPLCLYEKQADGGETIAVDHYLNDLVVADVSDEMTPSSFLRAVQANATLRNEGYSLIVRNGLGEVSELIPIDPVDLKVTRPVPGGPLEYRLRGVLVSSKSLLCIRGLTFNGIQAAPSLLMVKEIVGLAIALQDNASRFFGSGSRPGGVISHPQSLSEPAQMRLKQQIADKIKGPDNAHALLLLEEGLTFIANREDNNSSQFIESRQYQDKAIARYFGVPQSKVGILDESHYANAEQDNVAYATDTILSWVIQWEQEMNRKLLKPEERKTYCFRMDMDGVMRGDSLTRAQVLQIQRMNGIINQNEWRAKEHMNPVEGGDVYLVNSQLQPVGAPAGEPAAPGEPGAYPPKVTPPSPKTPKPKK